MWVLGTEPRSSGRAVSAEPSLQHPSQAPLRFETESHVAQIGLKLNGELWTSDPCGSDYIWSRQGRIKTFQETKLEHTTKRLIVQEIENVLYEITDVVEYM